MEVTPGSLPEVEQRLRAAGFAPASDAGPAHDHDHAHGHGHPHDHGAQAPHGRGLLLAPGLPRIVGALLLALGAELAHAFLPAGWAPLGMALAVAAVGLSGLSTYWKGVQSLTARSFTVM